MSVSLLNLMSAKWGFRAFSQQLLTAAKKQHYDSSEGEPQQELVPPPSSRYAKLRRECEINPLI